MYDETGVGKLTNAVERSIVPIEELGALTQSLHTQIESLERRLEPVLYPEPPANQAQAKDSAPVRSPLHTFLGSTNQSLQYAIGRLQNLEGRIEL